MTSEIAERCTCNKNSMCLLYNTVTIFYYICLYALQNICCICMGKYFYTYILTKSDNLMSEFSDNIHHHELKEMRLTQSSKCAVLCLLAETGQYAIHLNLKEK